MRYIAVQSFVDPVFKREDILGKYAEAPLGVQLQKMHEQCDREKAYAYLASDFHWGMSEKEGEAILKELGFNLAGAIEFETSMKIVAKLWLHKKCACIAETQGGDSWFANFDLQNNGNENGLVVSGGSRFPTTIENGDCIFHYSFASQNGVRPTLELLLQSSEESWLSNTRFYVREELALWDGIVSRIFKKSTAKKAPLLCENNKTGNIEDVLSQSGLKIIEKEEEFIVTKNTNKRYWFQFQNGRLTSYSCSLEEAKILLNQEKLVMDAALKAGGDFFERNNNQFQESGYVSFQLNNRCAKCAIVDGKAVLMDYCTGQLL